MEQCYVVGTNMPGYMPDSDPSECESWQQAHASVLEELGNDIDFFAEVALYAEFPEDRSNAAAKVVFLEEATKIADKWAEGEHIITAAGRVYWLALAPQV